MSSCFPVTGIMLCLLCDLGQMCRYSRSVLIVKAVECCGKIDSKVRVCGLAAHNVAFKHVSSYYLFCLTTYLAQ